MPLYKLDNATSKPPSKINLEDLSVDILVYVASKLRLGGKDDAAFLAASSNVNKAVSENGKSLVSDCGSRYKLASCISTQEPGSREWLVISLPCNIYIHIEMVAP
jgi:hypothetical protein